MTSNTPSEHESELAIMQPRRGPRRGSLRTVTIRPMPLTEREVAGDAVAVQGVLPLQGLTASSVQVATPPGRGRRTRRRHVQEFTDADVTMVARRVCRGMVEVISGERPASQLLRCTSERVYTDIARRGMSAKNRRRMTTERQAHTRIERVSIQRRSPRSVEVFARLRRGPRVHALAVRLELVSGRWTCVSYDTDQRL